MTQRRKITVRLWAWLKGIPHLFGKLVVSWCLFWLTAAGFYALRIVSRTGNDPAGTLAVIYGGLGGELLLMGMRTILSEK